MRRPAALFSAATLIVILAAAPADEPKGPTAYRVSVDGNIKITTSLGPTIVRRTQAEFDYRVLRREGGVDVALDRFGLRVLANGEELDFIDMSRSRIVTRRQGGSLDVRRDQAPPAMLRMFEQFDPPLAKIELAADGAEASRKVKAEDGAIVEARALDLARLFHPKFPEGESKWEAPVVMAFGRNQTAKGALRYAKRPADESSKNGLVQVDVTGFLQVEGKHDLAEIKRGAYKVSGRQTYDPAARDWVAGRLVVTAGFEAVTPNGVIIKGDGPVTYTLTRREASPKAAKGKTKS
jgi:hypothetical protein